jgi:NADH-quinone oxidoreductase subunit M
VTLPEIPWAAQAAYPLLATLQLLPIAGLALVAALRGTGLALGAGLATVALELGVALDLFRRYDPTQAALQLAEQLDILPPLVYHAAVDGMAVAFVLLTALLTLLLVVYGAVRGLRPVPRFLAAVLAAEAALVGMFTTVDLLWFVLLSALELVLVGYLLWRWATSPQKDLMFARYLQFMGTSLLLLAAGTFLLGWSHAGATGGTWTFNLRELAAVPVPAGVQSIVFFLLFYGFAIRIPLFPLHGWLPLAAEHGNIAIGPVFLLGLKTGVYGLLRFVLPVLPEAVLRWHGYVVAFAVAGVFYAAVLALLQQNLRRLLAYAVVSHTSVLVIGLFSLSQLAFQGAVVLSLDFGLAIAGLLFMTGFVYRRTRTTLLPRLGGLFDRIPVIGVAFLVAALSIVGMPGTPGFDAAHLMLEAAIDRFGAFVTIAAALGNVAAAGFLLWAFQRAFLAPPREGVEMPVIERASPMERALAVTLVAVLLGTGFYSEPWLRLTDRTLAPIAALYGEGTDGPGH